jgi:uncharacterized membrane protein YvbJ
MICNNCGVENDNDAVYCENCGKVMTSTDSKSILILIITIAILSIKIVLPNLLNVCILANRFF